MISFTSDSYSDLEFDGFRHIFIITGENNYDQTIPYYLKLNNTNIDLHRTFKIKYTISTKKDQMFDRLHFNVSVGWDYNETLNVLLYKNIIPAGCNNNDDFERGYIINDFIAIPLYPIFNVINKTLFEREMAYYMRSCIEST